MAYEAGMAQEKFHIVSNLHSQGMMEFFIIIFNNISGYTWN